METAKFAHDGRVMVYTRSGTPTGRAFVLVHGIGMGHRVFRGLAEKLDPAGVVYAIDLPGFGDSPEPAEALDMPGSGDFLAAFVDSLPEQARTLVGHSMGTQVVAEALVRHPGIARRAVLIAPTVNPLERTAGMQALRMVQDLAIESPKVLVIGVIQYADAQPPPGGRAPQDVGPDTRAAWGGRSRVPGRVGRTSGRVDSRLDAAGGGGSRT